MHNQFPPLGSPYPVLSPEVRGTEVRKFERLFPSPLPLIRYAPLGSRASVCPEAFWFRSTVLPVFMFVPCAGHCLRTWIGHTAG